MKYLNKIIEYSLYLLIFLLPIQTRWIIKAGETEYSTYSLYWTDILLLFVLLLFVILKFSIFNFQFSIKFSISNFQTTSKSLITNHQSLTQWFVCGLVLASAVSAFFAHDKLLALYKIGWLILGIGLFWLIISANYSKVKLIYALLAGVFLQAVLGIWQFLTQSSFANKWFGIASHNPSDLGVSVVETIGSDGVGERWLRAYGGLDHPNMFGGLLTIAMLLMIILAITEGKIQNSKFKIQNSKFRNLTFYFLLFIFSTALFFSFSRTAWLGLVVGLIVLIAIVIINKNLFYQKRLTEIILAMGVLFFLLFSQYQNLIITRMRGEGRLEVKSTTERLTSFQDAWQVIKNNWLVGVGMGNYGLGIRNYELGIRNYELGIRDKKMPAWHYQPVHNVFLLVWAEIGVIGSLFFVGIIYLLIISNFQFLISNKIQITNYKLQITNLAVLLCLIIFMFFDHWLWSLHFGVLFFWLIIGLVSRGVRIMN